MAPNVEGGPQFHIHNGFRTLDESVRLILRFSRQFPAFNNYSKSTAWLCH